MAAALWIGILLGREMPAGWAWGCAALALVAGCAAWRTPRLIAAALIMLAALFAGAGRGAAHRQTIEMARDAIRAGAPTRIAGTVVEPPGLSTDRPLALVRVDRSAPPLLRGTRVRLRLPEHAVADWGDRVECLAELALPSPPRNPGGWDARLGAEAAGVAGAGRAITIRRMPPAGWRALGYSTLARWRRGVERCLGAGLGAEARELVIPLVTGDRAALPAELDADFRAAGLIHLLALSGLHVSALAAVARAVAASLGGGVASRAVAGVVAAIFYAGIAGPLPSLARAVVTECWLGAARGARHAADPVQALAVTVLILLALIPGWALDFGFQLSCAASLGLASLAPFAVARCGRWRLLGAAVATTLAAQLVCAPILMARVFGLSWPALIANLVAVPTCGLLLASAWLAVLLELVAAGAGHPFFSACELLARALLAETGFAARWPAALIATGHEPAILLLAFTGSFLLVIATCAPDDLESRGRRWTAAREAMLGLGGFAAALALVLASTAPAARPRPGSAWIVALDVGQGDAIALGLADGWWLVDAGARSAQHDAGERVVRPFFRWAAVRRLNALVLTHDDNDHTGGARAVMRGVAVKQIIGPATPPGMRGPLAAFLPNQSGLGGSPSTSAHSRVSAGTALRRAGAGDTLHRAPTIAVLWPPRAASAVAARGDNAAGLVLELSVGPTRALLTADVDSLVENHLPLRGPIAWLKAGHHGSASSSGASFLARARPAMVLVSAGERNVYGHPSPLALARLERSGAKVERTDRDGASWVVLDATGFRLVDWRHVEPGGDRDFACSQGPSESGGEAIETPAGALPGWGVRAVAVRATRFP